VGVGLARARHRMHKQPYACRVDITPALHVAGRGNSQWRIAEQHRSHRRLSRLYLRGALIDPASGGEL